MQILQSAFSYIDQMSAQVQSQRTIPQQTLSLHVHQTLASPHIEVLQAKLNHRAENDLQPVYFKSYKDVTRINLKAQQVCIIFCPYEDRIWAKRFCSNEQLHKGFRLYIVTYQEEEYQRAQKYNSRSIIVTMFPNDIEIVANQIGLLTQQHMTSDLTNLLGRDYYHRYRSDQLLTIFVSEELVTAFRSQGKKILKNRQYRSVQIREFSTVEQLVFKGLTDISTRKKAAAKIDQLVYQQRQNRKLTPEQLLHLVRSKELGMRNLILIERRNPNVDPITEFIANDKHRRWEMVVIDDNKSVCQRVPNSLADTPLAENGLPQLNLIAQSSTLFVIIHRLDTETLRDYRCYDRVNCSNRLIVFGNNIDLGDALTMVQLKRESYGLLVVNQEHYKQFRCVIRSYIESRIPIFNLKILIRQSKVDSLSVVSNQSSILLGQQPSEEGQDLMSSAVLSDQNSSLLQAIMSERSNYFHPVSGLDGRRIVLLVNQRESQLLALAQLISSRNPRRIVVQYCQDLYHFEYVLSQLKFDEWGLIFLYEHNITPLVNILVRQSQLVIVGSASSRLVHQKILKQGTYSELAEFFNLIPVQQPSRVSNNSILMMYSDNDLPPQTLKRLDFQDQVARMLQVDTHNAEITVRLPSGLESENTSILQSRLVHSLKNNIRVKYYCTSSEIRDMGSKWQEKVQYLVIPDDYLPWAEEFAKHQVRQRFQILLYTYQPLPTHQRLVSKANLMRFKLVTNRWSEIEAYITRSHQVYLAKNQRLQIVLGKCDRDLEKMFDRSPILSQTYFKYYDEEKQGSIKGILKSINSQHMAIVLINQNREKMFDQGEIIEDIRKTRPSARTLLISSIRQSKYPRTLVSVQTLGQAGDWLKKIRVAEQTPSGRVKVQRVK